jgi:hypothetical protein
MNHMKVNVYQCCILTVHYGTDQKTIVCEAITQ